MFNLKVEKVVINNSFDQKFLTEKPKMNFVLTSLRILSNELQRKFPQDWNDFLNILMEVY